MSTKTGLTKNKKVVIPIIVVLLAVTVMVTATTLTPLTSTVTFTPTEATYGQQIYINVSKYAFTSGGAGGVSITIYLANGTGWYPIKTTTSNSSGGLENYPVIIPSSISTGYIDPGSYHIVVANSTAYAESSSTLDLVTVSFTPTTATSGQSLTITVSNGAFKSYSSVSIYFNNTYITTVSANATGGLTATIQVPYGIPAAKYTIALEGYAYNAPSTLVWVNSTSLFYEVFSLSPGFGSPGSTVQFTGFGFQPSETVNIIFDGVVVTTVKAGIYGNISGSFTVPSTAAVGSHTVAAVGQSSGVTYKSYFYVVSPSITYIKVSPSLVLFSSTSSVTVSVTGYGFPANTYVEICFGGQVVSTAYTNSSGTFETSFTVMPISYGNHTVKAIAMVNPVPIGSECPITGETYEGGYAKANLTVMPNLVVSTTTTCSSSTITVYGYGFPAGKPIEILVNGTNATIINNEYSSYSTSSHLVTSSSGTFWAVIQMPQTPGTYKITTNLTATYNGVTYPTPVYVTVSPSKVLVNGASSFTGYVGETVTVSGTCLPAGQVSLYISNTTYTVGYPNIATTTSGSFSVNINLPLLPPGKYTVYAQVVSTQVGTVASVVNATVIIPQPTISVTPSSGYEGECIIVKGQYFANLTLYSVALTINGTGLMLTYGVNSQYANGVKVTNPTSGLTCGTVTFYPNGTVVLPAYVPVTVPGTYTIFANVTVHSNLIKTGEEIVPSTISAPNDTLYAKANFTVQPSYITVGPSPAVPGGQIVITGYNFYPGTTVNIYIYLNGTTLVYTTGVQVNQYGQFSTTYSVPSTSGYLYIVANETSPTYIKGTPPNAVGVATANVTIANIYQAIISYLTQLLQCCSKVNSTLQQLMSEVNIMASEVSTVYSTVLNMSSTLSLMSSTLSNISLTLSSIEGTLTTIQRALSSINSTLMTMQNMMTTGLQMLSTINYNVVSVNNTVKNYGNNILSAVQSINTTVQSIKTVVPSVSTRYGTLTFTSPGAQTIYQSSTVGQVTITLYYTGYSTVWIYVYPIPGDTTHVVKLQVMSSMGYTVTVSGWRVDIYVTSASSVSPVTVYYSYTAIS